MNDLLHAKCQPLDDGKPMDDTEIRTHLAAVGGWRLSEGAIEKTFQFKNYHETIAFVNALAWICHTEDHHPDLSVSYNRCTARFNTHSVGGLSINDFICAAKVNALVSLDG